MSTVIVPFVDCGDRELITAVMGMPFLSFYTSVIRVDTPRRVIVDDEVIVGPDVEFLPPGSAVPPFTRAVAMEFGGLFPVTTASFYYDFEDLETPTAPTTMSFFAGTLPTGGGFFATLQLVEGEPGPTNPVQTLRVLVDTGAQASIISRAVAANLSLPFEPDFRVDACGVGGVVEGLPGYFVDYVKIPALGDALEFSQAPFVVVDLPSPELGTLDGILGMNFFWNRNVTFEPSLLSSSFLYLSDPIPFAASDANVDLRVNLKDLTSLIECLEGPDVSPVVECLHLDADENGSVDMKDLTILQNCFSGGAPAAANCGR